MASKWLIGYVPLDWESRTEDEVGRRRLGEFGPLGGRVLGRRDEIDELFEAEVRHADAKGGWGIVCATETHSVEL